MPDRHEIAIYHWQIEGAPPLQAIFGKIDRG
jgi:hypothetical protein